MRKDNFERTDGYTEGWLLYQAYWHHESAKTLYETADWRTFCNTGFNLHLSLEFLLKACLLYLDNKFPKSHDLEKLSKKISCINPKDREVLASLQYLHELRYLPLPTSQKAYAELLKKCISDFSKIRTLTIQIISLMPLALKNLYDDICSLKTCGEN